MSKMEKHLQELEEMTSGGSKDAVTFAGKGLELLKSMIGMKSLAKKAGEAGEEDADDDPEDPAETGEEQGEIKNAGKIQKSVRNGGDLEDADEDPEDPAQAGDDAEGGSIITNKGKKIPKSGSAAVKKSYEFEEDQLMKSFEEKYEDVIDASDAVADLAKSVKTIGQAHSENSALIKSVLEQNVVLGQAVAELLKSNASLASDLELLKKQPVTAPSPGYVVMNKKADNGTQQQMKLVKSDIQDVLVDAMNTGYENAGVLLKKLGVCHTPMQIQEFVDCVMPEDLKSKL